SPIPGSPPPPTERRLMSTEDERPPLAEEVTTDRDLTNRRGFLKRSAGAGGGLILLSTAACSRDADAPEAGGASETVTAEAPAGKDASSLIRHSELTFETKRAAFGTSVIVPYDRLFVRNNLPTPDQRIVEDRDQWELSVEGVHGARQISLAE